MFVSEAISYLYFSISVVSHGAKEIYIQLARECNSRGRPSDLSFLVDMIGKVMSMMISAR